MSKRLAPNTALGVQLPAPETSVRGGGAFSWLDFDGNGDLDYLVSGGCLTLDGDGLLESRTQVFRNMTPIANAAPLAPGSLTSSVTGSSALLTWAIQFDDYTVSDALTFKLKGTSKNLIF